MVKNDGADTIILNFCIVDKKGVVVPTADNLIHVEVIGDGYVRGVGNGDPNSHESDVLPERRAYCGWRIYRTTPQIFEKGTYKLVFSNVLCVC